MKMKLGIYGALTLGLLLTANSTTLLVQAPGSPVPVAGQAPKGAAIADLNSDGKLDLVVVSTFCHPQRESGCQQLLEQGDKTGRISLLLGDGRGAFAEFFRSQTIRSPFPEGTKPLAVAVGDFNRDGKADVALASSGSDQVIVRLGFGDGQLLPARNAQRISTGSSGQSPSDVVAADLNGDGIDDLAATVLVRETVAVIISRGDGTFAAPTHLPIGPGPQALVVADFNQDGMIDIATANLSDERSVSVLLGTGSSFQQARHIAIGALPRSIAAADFNSDGQLDLVIPSAADDTVIVLLGDGSGGFRVGGRFPAGPDPIDVAAADFNRDGKADVAAVNAEGLALLLGDGTGRLSLSDQLPAGQLPLQLAVGDLNRDGKPDIVVVNQGSNDVSVYLGQ